MTDPFHWTPDLQNALEAVAEFFDARKVGHVGAEGFRKSTPLMSMIPLVRHMIDAKLIVPGESIFLDMGCADARVNLFMRYVAKQSIGIEIDEWTLDEALPLENEVLTLLGSQSLMLPPDNGHLFHGDTLNPLLHEQVRKKTGICLEEVDLFFTFLTLYDVFADLIRDKGRSGALFMVYGLDLIIPEINGFEQVPIDDAIPNHAALYRKI